LEDAIDVAGRLPVQGAEIGPIGNQAAGGDEGAFEVDRRELMPCSKRNNQIAINERSPARSHNQTAIRGLRERRDDALDLAGVRPVDRGHLSLERRRHCLDDANEATPAGLPASRMTAARATPGAICLSSSTYFPLMLYSKVMKPVTLPPGRARLSTKPAPTGSPAIGKTIGTVRVVCSNGPTVEAPWARITSGASATNSAACLRISAGLVAQWMSIRMLRPSTQPRSCNTCLNAVSQG